ncbi:MAG: HAD family hydrolase [Mesorhizobium sp.]|nr:MAG: HAD family hydrolase [Mesorhizobium sp.]
MNESVLRRALLIIAVLGLALGLGVWRNSTDIASPDTIWTAATLPVVAALAISILRDFWIGRVGVDAVALVSMSAALLLGQALAAVVVAIMYAGGTVLEDLARGRAERNLRALTDRAPRVAHRKSAHGTETVAIDQVAVGDELLVRAGELLPVDGVLIDASAQLDESTVTGEPLPERRGAGDALRSGTVNVGEALVMRASAIADKSTYAAIVRMVAAAQTAKAPFIRMKGSAALEALAQIRTAIFDKTGTLTLGGAELIEIDVAPGQGTNEPLRLLASLEQASHHVLADSIVRIARHRNLLLSQPCDVREHRGEGLEGQVDGISVVAGSRPLVLGSGPLPNWAESGESRYRDTQVLRVFLAIDGRLAAVFTFGDAIREDAPGTVEALRSAGVTRIVMLTGDDGAAAEKVSASLDLDAVFADATPADKVGTVEAEKAAAPTMMVGDGINDAPALAAATVGIAMGARGGTASSEAADVVVLTDRLEPVAEALRIARRTRGIALQSIVVGLGLSGAAMIAAAMGHITPVAGALLQEGIDVAVIVNALRALGDGRLEHDRNGRRS